MLDVQNFRLFPAGMSLQDWSRINRRRKVQVQRLGNRID